MYFQFSISDVNIFKVKVEWFQILKIYGLLVNDDV